jgi:hypothetical protein
MPECPARCCWSASDGLFRVHPLRKKGTPRPHARVESGFPPLTERTSPPHNRSTEVPGREVERTPTRTASITLHPTDRRSTELGLTRECVTSDTPFHPATREPGPALAKPDPGMQPPSPVRDRDATGPESSRDSPGLGASSTKHSKCLPPFCLNRAGRTHSMKGTDSTALPPTNTAQRTRSFEDRGLNHATRWSCSGPNESNPTQHTLANDFSTCSANQTPALAPALPEGNTKPEPRRQDPPERLLLPACQRRAPRSCRTRPTRRLVMEPNARLHRFHADLTPWRNRVRVSPGPEEQRF